MSETAFKHHFGAELAEDLARRITAVHPLFPAEQFVGQVAAQVGPLELKGRVNRIAAALREHLPPSYTEALNILLGTLGPPHSEAEGMFKDGWYVMPLAQFVETYGLEHYDESIAGLHAITQRHTSEFAIRPFLIRYPEQTLAILQRWAHDESFHVRRLVSEGSRPRLPWATRLTMFIDNPAPVLELLEPLRDDPSAYVRKSVANNLNDIAKDHPDLVLATCERWSRGASDRTRGIVRHALRTLVKQAHPGALRLLGAETPQVQLLELELDRTQLSIGDTLLLNVTLQSTTNEPQQLIIDYVLHMVGARGELRPKVFKLRTQLLAPGEVMRLQKRVPIRPVSVRRYYPGRYRLEVQVNGAVLGGVDFDVLP